MLSYGPYLNFCSLTPVQCMTLYVQDVVFCPFDPAHSRFLYTAECDLFPPAYKSTLPPPPLSCPYPRSLSHPLPSPPPSQRITEATTTRYGVSYSDIMLIELRVYGHIWCILLITVEFTCIMVRPPRPPTHPYSPIPLFHTWPEDVLFVTMILEWVISIPCVLYCNITLCAPASCSTHTHLDLPSVAPSTHSRTRAQYSVSLSHILPKGTLSGTHYALQRLLLSFRNLLAAWHPQAWYTTSSLQSHWFLTANVCIHTSRFMLQQKSWCRISRVVGITRSH